MAQSCHVPKFGNWENDNIPYTAYFENARKEKTGVKINPNDPEENPEAFMYRKDEFDLSFGQSIQITTTHLEENPSGRQKSITSESAIASDESNSDYSMLQAAGFRRQRSARNKKRAKHHRAASVPKFGSWDQSDPNSGEGFTAIFNRVKEEKQIASSTFPSLPPKPTYRSYTHTDKETSSSRLKSCCCLFSCGSR
ncbi:RPM1-interacting protein 4-like [Jatropha curcas]|uniref:RPM1-interacting protein 4-like n=1 Tax=Jatropha curcas TaxID=180498 RepID=UPI0009D69997|nr:RPM1-interacting protein 4-like [Jatropha curcas]